MYRFGMIYGLSLVPTEATDPLFSLSFIHKKLCAHTHTWWMAVFSTPIHSTVTWKRIEHYNFFVVTLSLFNWIKTNVFNSCCYCFYPAARLQLFRSVTCMLFILFPIPIKSYFMSFSHSEYLTSAIINAVNHNSTNVLYIRIYTQYVRRSSIFDE